MFTVVEINLFATFTLKSVQKMSLPDTYVPGFHNEEDVRKMRYNTFGETGLKVSQLSLGTGGFCLQYG